MCVVSSELYSDPNFWGGFSLFHPISPIKHKFLMIIIDNGFLFIELSGGKLGHTIMCHS